MIEVTAPASKSVSHRAFIAAALGPGRTVVRNALASQDLAATRRCLEAMGARFSGEGKEIAVEGMAAGPRSGSDGPALLDVGESGTTCRLLTAVAAAGKGRFEIRGEGRMHDRPIGELAQTLESQTVAFEWLEKSGYPPMVVVTEGLSGGVMTISLEESSQYLSGLLLAAPLAAAPCEIVVIGEKIVSWPYVGLTLQVMKAFGVEPVVEVRDGGSWKRVDASAPGEVRPGSVRFLVRPGTYGATEYTVEGDWSNASYFLAAGALVGPLAVHGLSRDSLQGDRAILEIIRAMGAKVLWDESGVTATVLPMRLAGQSLDMGSCPDLVPTVAVLAAHAEGPTTIRNVAHLRIKESDRLAALATEIAKTGCGTELLDDGIIITPRTLPKGREIGFSTYGDHRIAMSMSLFGLSGINVRLDNPGCVAKSFPGFWDQWNKVAGQGS